MNLLQTAKNILYRKFVAFFILLFVSIGLVIWFFISIFHIHSQRVKSALEVESIKVERILIDRMQSTYSIVKSMNSQILINSHDKTHIHEILRKFKSTPELSDSFSWTIFSWSDENYKLTVDAKYGIMDDYFDLSIRDYIFLTKSDPGILHLGNPVYGSTSKKWMIPGGVGLVDKNGAYLGAIVIGFEIDALARSIYKNVNNENIGIEIVNGNGISILEVDSKYSGMPRKDKISNDLKISKSLIASQRDKPYIDTISVNLLSDKKAFLIKNLDILNYSLIVKYDQEPMNNSLWESFILRSLEIFIMFLVSGSLLILVYKIEKDRQKRLIEAKNVAENANEAKDKILFSISHDIKNYIFGIGGLGRMIIDSKKTSEVLKNEDLQIVETICDQAEELKYFVEDLLDINHVEAGGLSLGAVRAVKVKDMIDTIVTFSKSLASDNQIYVRTEIENNLPEFNCDPRRIKQILINLVSNAIKYSRANSEVIIKVKYLENKNQLYIEVVDKGFGMSEEDVKKYLSGNGVEIDKSEIEQVKEVDSHGIGVSIVLRLVEIHNGTIEVDSGKNLGTKVKVYFDLSKPLKVKKRLSLKKDNIPFKQSNKTSLKDELILLVEDNPVNIKITCKVLELEGYKPLYAENGKEAIKMIEKYHPDLILMDGEMPIMNGYEATKNIRSGLNFDSFRKFKTIPIIGLMSSSNAEIIKKSMESGMNDHVEKSTSRTKLIKMIESHFYKK